MNTENFTIVGDEWRITWDTTIAKGFQVYLMDAVVSKGFLTVVEDHNVALHGSRLLRDAGTYYLTVTGSASIAIDEYR